MTCGHSLSVTFFPEGLINSSWICGNPEDFLQGSNLLEHKTSYKHLEFLTAVSLSSHLFCEARSKREVFCAVWVSSIHHAFKSPILKTSVSFLCSYPVHCSYWGLPLASSADIVLIWMAKHIYFCEAAFILLLLPPEPTNDLTGFLMALWRDRGSILLFVWALILKVITWFDSAHSGVQLFIQRSLNCHLHSDTQNILNSKHSRSGERKANLKKMDSERWYLEVKLARLKAVSLVSGVETRTLQSSRNPHFSVGLKGVCFVLAVRYMIQWH